MEFEFSAEVFLWQGNASWHFVALPSDLSETISELCGHLKAGWGSIRVRVTVGSTTWTTSIFPDKSRAAYLLPLKAGVRHQEQIGAGDTISVLLAPV